MPVEMKIPFNIPPVVGSEISCIGDAVRRRRLCGDNHYSKKCEAWMEANYNAQKVMLTPSCTHALEMSALLLDIEPGDEVIMPSFTFVSTADAFVLRGARIVFVDIRPDTQNIDENLIEAAITPKTKAVVVVHYAGVACEMDTIAALCQKHGLALVEDAAQGVHAAYKGRALGTIGDFGCYSFHETKNYTMGEGGALLIRDGKYNLPAAVIREKGTNRSEFLLGLVDKYTWVNSGSSYLPSEMAAAFLYPQLLQADEINRRRLAAWQQYYDALKPLQDRGLVTLPVVPEGCQHNAHMFYIKTAGLDERDRLLMYLRDKGISSSFHYVPLHSSPQGRRCSEFRGTDRHTTETYQRLLRLPMFMEISEEEVSYVCEAIHRFYQ